jgi:hypothetical protein
MGPYVPSEMFKLYPGSINSKLSAPLMWNIVKEANKKSRMELCVPSEMFKINSKLPPQNIVNPSNIDKELKDILPMVEHIDVHDWKRYLCLSDYLHYNKLLDFARAMKEKGQYKLERYLHKEFYQVTREISAIKVLPYDVLNNQPSKIDLIVDGELLRVSGRTDITIETKESSLRLTIELKRYGHLHDEANKEKAKDKVFSASSEASKGRRRESDQDK